MKIVRTVAEMVSVGGGDLGFVPTMGAFHEGHLSLMREARKNHERVCVSLFVNPLQFGQTEDLGRYPRNEERDFALAKEVGVDTMFVPTADEIYPREITKIHVPELSEVWEGRLRVGHFTGVATVVAKLFNIFRPDVAYFGWKDLQQCLVLQRMAIDLNMPVRLRFIETVREPDGLALSSRNVYLNNEHRHLAPMLRKVLVGLSENIRVQPQSVEAFLAKARQDLVAAGFEVDYLELVSLSDMAVVRSPSNAALIVAGKLGTTRLIDNLRLGVGCR